MFGKDPDIKVEFDEDNYNIKLFVEKEDKANALVEILPIAKVFGNVVVTIEVIPADSNEEKDILDVYQTAFAGNPVFSYAKQQQLGPFTLDFVVFKPEVVQFFNDSLADINGNCSTLYQDIAQDIFEEDEGKVYFCTDLV